MLHYLKPVYSNISSEKENTVYLITKCIVYIFYGSLMCFTLA